MCPTREITSIADCRLSPDLFYTFGLYKQEMVTYFSSQSPHWSGILLHTMKSKSVDNTHYHASKVTNHKKHKNNNHVVVIVVRHK